MPVVATESSRFSDIVKYLPDLTAGYQVERITVNDAAGVMKFGTALGTVTATGKWKVSLSAATDGSQTIKGVFLCDAAGNSQDLTLSANTDTQVLALVRGPAIVTESVPLGTGHTVATLRAALLALNPPVLVDSQG